VLTSQGSAHNGDVAESRAAHYTDGRLRAHRRESTLSEHPGAEKKRYWEDVGRRRRVATIGQGTLTVNDDHRVSAQAVRLRAIRPARVTDVGYKTPQTQSRRLHVKNALAYGKCQRLHWTRSWAKAIGNLGYDYGGLRQSWFYPRQHWAGDDALIREMSAIRKFQLPGGHAFCPARSSTGRRTGR